MERKFLKDLGLESEIIDKILDQHSTDIGRHKTAADAAQSKMQQLEQDLAKRDTDITALKSVDAADLQSKLDALQAQYDAEVQSRTQQEAARTYEDRRNAFFSGVTFADEYTKRGLLSAFDEKKFVYNESEQSFAGAKEWMEQVQSAAPSAFVSKAQAPSVVRETQTAQPTTVTKEQFAKMGYAKRVALKATDPELYNTLKE